jgi:predicted PurR-regulated permease PerM
MNNLIPNMENPWVRRPLIILMTLCAAPFLIALMVVEAIWETVKAIVKIIKTQVQEAAPAIKNFVNQIKEAW